MTEPDRVAAARENANREQASTFSVLRVFAAHPAGLTKEALWSELVSKSKEEAWDPTAILLVGFNGKLDTWLSNRVALGHVSVAAGPVPVASTRIFKLTDEGQGFLLKMKPEADTLINTYLVKRASS
jgi:hypothetical protein